MVETQHDVWPPPVAAAGDRTADGRDRRGRDRPSRRGRRRHHGFDAFISYSHHGAGETALARQLEQGLEQIGRRWTERRALSVFLDQNDLGANSELTPRLRRDLDQSAWLVFLASPESAAPDSYCAQELAHWFAKRPDAADRLLIVLTGGTLAFRADEADPSAGSADVVDWARSTAAPAIFRGKLTKEPTYVDLSWAREDGTPLSIRHHPRFREAVTWVAAPIHGYDSPQELDSEDLRRFRRGRRFRRVGVGALAVLTVAAIAAAIVAGVQTTKANRELQRSESRALASTALANADDEPDLALLQALESVREADTAQSWGSLLGVLGEPSRLQQRSSAVHTTPVTALATSADGRLAASGDAAGSVVIWTVDPAVSVGPASVASVVPGDESSPVADLAITDEGGALVVTALSADGGLRFLDAATGSVISDRPTAERFTTAALSDDGTMLAGVVDTDEDGDDDDVAVVDATTGSTIDRAPVGEDVIVERLLFRPGSQTVVGSTGNTVFSWTVGGSEGPVALDVFESGISALAFSPDGGRLAVGEVEGDIWILDVDREEAPSRIPAEPAPTSAAKALAFTATTADAPAEGLSELVSAHTNGDVRVWSVFEAEGFALEQHLSRGHRDEVTAVEFRPDGHVVSGGYDGEVLWWRSDPVGGLAEVLPSSGLAHTGDVWDVALLDAHGASVVSLDGTGTLILSAQDGTGERWRADEATAVDAANDVVAYAQGDGSISVGPGGSTAAGAAVSLSGEHEEAPYVLDLSDDGTGLVSVTDTAVVWDVAKAAVRSRLSIPDDFSPETALYGTGDRIWLGGQDAGGAAAIEFDAGSGEVVGEPIRHGGSLGDSVGALALGLHGTMLATGGSDRAIRLWDPETHQPLDKGELAGHRESVIGVAFTPSGEDLISADRDGIVSLWRVADRQLVTVLGGPTDGINALAVSTDGRTLVVASEDDHVYRWTLDRRAWIDRACELAGRNMTAAEWRRHGRGPQLRLCDHPGDEPLVNWSVRLG